jgi:hypothetical protein
VDWNKFYFGVRWGGKEAETIDQSWDTKSRVVDWRHMAAAARGDQRSMKNTKKENNKISQNLCTSQYNLTF